MSRPLTIGIDARAAVEEPAGRGQVVRDLVRALAARDDPHRYVLYLREPWELDLDDRFQRVCVSGRDPLWHVRVGRAASRSCDAFFVTNSYLLAWFVQVPSVVLVHDLIAFIPEAHGQRRASLIERATIRPALRRARLLLANSENTRRDLLARHPRVEGKTRSVPLAASPQFKAPVDPPTVARVREHYDLPGRFALSAGTLEPRKNIVRLVRAWAALPDELREERVLALVGRRGWEMAEILAQVDAHRESVRLLGYVPDEHLPALYHACEVFCYPSLYEGFGLPVHEAMCCGAPVLTSDRSSLPEVAGDAALLVDPEDDGAIRRGLERLLSDPKLREQLSAAGHERCAAFDWSRTAARIVAAVEDAAGRES